MVKDDLDSKTLVGKFQVECRSVFNSNQN
jgi:hypothetical protein